MPLRRRLSGRLPSMRRVGAVLGVIAAAALLVWLIQGPWLRVSEVAWAGERYTAPEDLEAVLDSQRGMSVLAVDTDALQARIERLPAVARAAVDASLTGRVEARVTERTAAFVWQTASGRFIGAADGTIFTGGDDVEPVPDTSGLPVVIDQRFVARLVTVGDVIPASVLRIALRLSELDPARLGSASAALAISVDDEYGFRLASVDPEWEVALGVYGLDPDETDAEADARLERQVTAVRTLFAERPETGIGWVDVRNPSKVYFRAKG
ncbi:MAG TPA: FtsQ-type POTRA domain-containing protein [Candidatus Limnocylindria bacterium]|nr:FtsQ-type POTRA domain-containing protein [Candidatus Limnocylindria bacterium]